MNKFKNIKCQTGEIAKDYQEYLKTKHWKELRDEVADHSDHTCTKCLGIFRTGFHIHHNTYKRLGKEKLSDLDFYCNKCHAVIHKNRKNKKDFNRHYNNTISNKMSKLSEEQILKVIEYVDSLTGTQ